MKQIFTLFSAFVVLTSFTLSASIDEMVKALKEGNAAEIARYFDNTVEITLPDKSNSYSKSQGEVVLRDFFINNRVDGSSFLYIGANTGPLFCLGLLVTKNGTYRATVFMKLKGGRQILQEIRFEHL